MSTVDTRGLRWWKSSRSGSEGGQCVEVAAAETAWHVRDSKNPSQGSLRASAEQWQAFVNAIKDGTL
jgi:hypothetical protein